jgi:aminopeptidase YwaD
MGTGFASSFYCSRFPMHVTPWLRGLISLLFFFPSLLLAQPDWLPQARQDIAVLCSDSLAGRGYQDQAHQRAAAFIARRFDSLGLRPPLPEDRFLQIFPLKINRISSARLTLNGQILLPGADFIVHRMSAGGELPRTSVVDLGHGLEPPRQRVKGRIVLIRAGWPAEVANSSELKDQYQGFSRPEARIEAVAARGAVGVVLVQNKLTAGFARETFGLPVVELLEDRLPKRVRKASLQVTAEMARLNSYNVLGVVPGTTEPDSFLVLTAHYDHLGRLDSAIFAGGNDNASGTALLLALAAHFAENPLPYSLLFIAFGGEETGLIGSGHYVHREPVISLARMKFLLNLDLMGNGDEGIMAVGGKDFPPQFDQLVALNDSLQAVPVVRARANAPNSDHYFFLQQGVPGFFIYTLGGPPHYHDIYDTAANLQLSRYEEVFGLLEAFLRSRGE